MPRHYPRPRRTVLVRLVDPVKAIGHWEKLYGAERRRKDRALLASVEREIANEEKLRASPAYQADVAKMKRWNQEVIAEMAAHEGKGEPFKPSPRSPFAIREEDALPERITEEEQRARIARAFGRPH